MRQISMVLLGLSLLGVFFIYKILKPDLVTSLISLPQQSENDQEVEKSSTILNQKNGHPRVFLDTFDVDSSIEEVASPQKSESADWWINSGAFLYIKNGVAKTVQGDILVGSRWHIAFKKNNPDETDGGIHPQNIFRLVSRGTWKELSQRFYFMIVADHLSKSVHRKESNGLFLFNRYQDGDNLYYTGIRVDGFAVIKKKIKGKYFTLAYNQIYPGKYDREKNPNLLPHNQWIGLKSEVTNNGNDSVNIKLYIDRERNGNWELVAEAVDEGKKYGKGPFFDAGHGGIRTDFMDVEFDDYRIEEIKK